MPIVDTSFNHADLPKLPDWDVIVIGAGPAGALASQIASSKGLRTLLVEAKAIPGKKVCGGCLNARAMQLLETHGLMPALNDAGAIHLQKMLLALPGTNATWPLDAMTSISRWAMDPLLVQAAVKHGVTFLPETRASVLPDVREGFRSVQLASKEEGKTEVRARVVVVASGLSSNTLNALEEMRCDVAPGARIGVGALLDGQVSPPFPTLTMAVGKDGYVGMAPVEKGKINIAAAIDSVALQRSESIPALLASILHQCRLPVPEGWYEVDWHATPALTRQRRIVAGERLLLLGDAAGYIEPFTGEGMAWALQTAHLSATVVEKGSHQWSPSLTGQWQQTFEREVRSRQWICRGLSQLLRYPRFADIVLRFAKTSPWITRRFLTKITGPRE